MWYIKNLQCHEQVNIFACLTKKIGEFKISIFRRKSRIRKSVLNVTN